MKIVLAALTVILLQASPVRAQNWKSYNELGDLYPSYAIALANLVQDDEKDDTHLGDANGIMGIVFTPTKANTRIRLEIRCDNSFKLFETTVLDVVAPKAGVEYVITPLVPFNQLKLASVGQSVTTYITYKLTINDKPQPPRTERLRVRSINDCPFAFQDDDGEETSIDFMFAAYVNEDHPYIQQILQEALQKHYIDSFSGYQGEPTDVYRQVMAIWRVLQERGIRYSSITMVAPTSDNVASQHVRLLDESVRYTQANCADGTVMLASILRKIDINPVLVVVPGHMFIGFDLDSEGKNQAYLETTMLGVDARNTEIARQKLYQTLLGSNADTKAQVAVRSFVAALESGNSTFAESKNKIKREKEGYAVVDIGAVREAGIAPIMYVGK